MISNNNNNKFRLNKSGPLSPVQRHPLTGWGTSEEPLLEPDARRANRIVGYGLQSTDNIHIGIAPVFSTEAKERWAAKREAVGIEKLFK